MSFTYNIYIYIYMLILIFVIIKIFDLKTTTLYSQIIRFRINWSMNVGPCHYGMARPQVADGGTASNMEGSCE
jgi:hypothetical protein